MAILNAFCLRCKSIMKVARAKLELIKPDEVNMEEYEVSSLSNPFSTVVTNCYYIRSAFFSLPICLSVCSDWDQMNVLRVMSDFRDRILTNNNKKKTPVRACC